MSVPQIFRGHVQPPLRSPIFKNIAKVQINSLTTFIDIAPAYSVSVWCNAVYWMHES